MINDPPSSSAITTLSPPTKLGGWEKDHAITNRREGKLVRNYIEIREKPKLKTKLTKSTISKLKYNVISREIKTKT